MLTVTERVLHDSVLERVKTDHRNHAANSQHARQELEQRFELGKLFVHRDAKPLKGLGCRVDAPATSSGCTVHRAP